MLDLLAHCLTKGLQFSIMLPVISPPTMYIAPLHLEPAFIDDQTTHIIPQDRWEKVSAKMVLEYYHNMQDVLRHPHACQFLA
jgi:hypothetical protein